jgi:NADH:ubiquinone oxidoreductase subunit F (NADH-binding)
LPEERIVLRHCDIIDPKNIETYLARDGFKALEKATHTMSPTQVVEEIKKSGLRGRGGAGFPTGLKWELCANTPAESKYLICNADEGEVGTFKDKYILERDPFSLMEGIAIAGYAIGARQAFIYLRAEYHHLLETLNETISRMKKLGLLKRPDNPEFDIQIREGAGAYVCGEESALMESIEGKRGEARYRPPFPPTEGLWRKPAIINNVETLMNIPAIVLQGADWFSQRGTEQSKGTKVFSVSGDVRRPGVYELLMGSPLKELLQLSGAGDIKMVQIGGASGRVLPQDKSDTPLSFETVLGAGAVIVFDQSRDAVAIALRNAEFFAEESCGLCTPCREGTLAMVEILTRLSQDAGVEEDLKVLEDLGRVMMLASLCGLGQAAPNHVLDTLQYFRGDYEAKIKQLAASR